MPKAKKTPAVSKPKPARAARPSAKPKAKPSLTHNHSQASVTLDEIEATLRQRAWTELVGASDRIAAAADSLVDGGGQPAGWKESALTGLQVALNAAHTYRVARDLALKGNGYGRRS